MTEPEFITEISSVEDGIVLIRGYSHDDIIGSIPYASAVFMTLVGRLPSEEEGRLVDAMLTSLLDHGFVASTVSAARYIASGNPEFIPAVAGGLLAAGANTVSPGHSVDLIEEVLAVKRSMGMEDRPAVRKVLEARISRGERIPGLGHPIHKDSDFRAERLFLIAEEMELLGESTLLLKMVHQEFLLITGKTKIPINIDGCLACLGRDLGLTGNQTVALAILAVLPGLMAHVSEELEANIPLRFIRDGIYVGEGHRSLPGSE
jgi:citrate synthase